MSGMSESFDFCLAVEEFEGPLDLLLYLIRRDDIDLMELRVAEIADQYLNFIDTMQALDLDVASEYLLMAATLAWMKSRVLLPRDDTGDEEIEDLRAELIQKLLEYERFQRASERLDERPLLGRETFRTAVEVELAGDADRTWAPVSVYALVDVLAELLATMPEIDPQSALIFEAQPRTIEEGAQAWASFFARGSRFLLREVLAEAQDRSDLVVRFLALLELIKIGELVAVQEAAGGEIHIARADATQPIPDYAAMVKGAYEYGTTEGNGDR